MGDAVLKMLEFRISDPVVLSALGLGAFILFIGFILGRRSRSNKFKNAFKPTEDKVQTSKNSSKTIERPSNNTDRNISGGNKRAKNKKRRDNQQEFTHSWFVGSLKGHTGPVRDMKFSSNDKFLASCAEDCSPAPKEKLKDARKPEAAPGYKANQEMSKGTSAAISSNHSEISTNNNDNISSALSTPTSSTKEKSDHISLSRRQRKNRRASQEQNRDRDDDNDDDNTNNSCRHSQCLTINNRCYENNQIRIGKSSNSRLPLRGLSYNKNHQHIVRYERRNHKHCLVPTNNVYVIQNFHQNGINSVVELANGIHILYCASPNNDYTIVDNYVLQLTLREYIINPSNLQFHGYPIEESAGHAYFMHDQAYYNHRNQKHHLDVNAQEFIPNKQRQKQKRDCDADSGNSSGDSVTNSDADAESSDSEKNSDSTELISWSSTSSTKSEEDKKDSEDFIPKEIVQPTKSHVLRQCARCFKSFLMTDNFKYLEEEPCTYHWGKKHRIGDNRTFEWQCCKGLNNAPGCTVARMHVWSGIVVGCNKSLSGYVQTTPCPVISPCEDYGIYAIDCEMCYTRHGLEVTRVTVVGLDGEIVYDTFIKPKNEIIDYNTRFSGITPEILKDVTITLPEVQAELSRFIYSQTILIGHALENDLRALKMIHSTIVDTTAVFPHFSGHPFKKSLKSLAKAKLDREIQVAEHDSVEDARTVIDLMRFKVWEDYFQVYHYTH